VNWGIGYELYGLRKRLAAIICVSDYATTEVRRVLGDDTPVLAIYHGVDHDIFHPDVDAKVHEEPYFFHISHQPVKNFHRVLAAYERLSQVNKPSLIVITRGFPDNNKTKGVKLIREPLKHRELAKYYQNAIGFLFPSLRETFGMPIIEAMACGCPVITSNITACSEVAGGSAILVNPRSVDEITNAMKSLVEDHELRRDLHRRGLEWAKNFTWRKSALKHLEVFQKVACTYDFPERE